MTEPSGPTRRGALVGAAAFGFGAAFSGSFAPARAASSDRGKALILLNEDMARYSDGRYSTMNDTWGRRELVNGVDYVSHVTVVPDQFPRATRMSWSWPAARSVGSYLAVVFRLDPDEAFEDSGRAFRIDHLDALSIEFEVDIQAEPGAYFALSEGFLYSDAAATWPPVSEVGVFYHPPGFEPTVDAIVTVGGVSGTIAVDPVSQTGGDWNFIKIALERPLSDGVFDIHDLFLQLKGLGLVSGREFVTSWKTGVETVGGTGAAAVSRYVGHFSASPKMSLSASPVRRAYLNDPYDGFQAVAQDGVAPYTFSRGGPWPPGLELDGATGAVSGVPLEVGVFEDLEILVTDGRGASAAFPRFVITVSADPAPTPEPADQGLADADPERFLLDQVERAGGGEDYRGGNAAYRFRETQSQGQHKFHVAGDAIAGLSGRMRLRAQALLRSDGRNAWFQLADGGFSNQIIVRLDLARGTEQRRSTRGDWRIEDVHIIPQGSSWFLVAIDFVTTGGDELNWIVNLLDEDRESYRGDGRGILAHGFRLLPRVEGR